MAQLLNKESCFNEILEKRDQIITKLNEKIQQLEHSRTKKLR